MGDGSAGRHGPLLVRPTRTVPDLQPGAVVSATPGGVQALVGRWIYQLIRRGGAPLLCAGAVAVVQLDHGPVGGGAGADIHALAEGTYRAVGPDRPALRGGAVAVVELDRRAVGRIGTGHVDALAAVPGD